MIGRTVSHYRILSELGAGGMGVVYRAEDLTLGRDVALKLLPPHVSSDPDARRRFVHEAKAAAALDHSGICTVYDSGESDGQLFIAMALIEGRTLKDRIAEGPLPLPQALEIAAQVADALDEAHGKGIAHRDIKPANIMLTSRGQAKVMDFGLAQVADTTLLTRSGAALGTAAYMSPEQARGEKADRRTDIWSLGVVLYEMVAGRRPFPGGHEAALFHGIQNADPDPLTGLRPGVTREISRIVGRCLAKDPARRYQHARELAADLRRAGTGSQETGPLATPPRRWRPRRAWVAAAVATVALLAVWLGPRLLKHSDDPRRMALAVIDFRDSSSPAGQTVGAALTGLLQIGLVEASPIRVLSPEYLLDLRRRTFGAAHGPIADEQALEVARRAGATLLLCGHVTTLDAGRTVMWRLIDTRDGGNVAAKREAGAELIPVADRIITDVVAQIQAGAGVAATSALPSVDRLTTASPEAYQRFVAAEVARGDDRDEEALSQLQAAVRIDSTFALAWQRMSDIHWAFTDLQRAKQEAETAWRLRSRLGVKDRLMLESRRLQLAGDLGAAWVVYADMAARWPDDRTILREYAGAMAWWWFFPEAQAIAEQGLAHYPDDERFHGLWIQCLLARGRVAEALAAATQWQRRRTGVPEAWNLVGEAHLAAGDIDSAEAAFRRACSQNPGDPVLMADLARCEYRRGRVAAAEALFRQLLARPDLSPYERTRWQRGFNDEPGMATLRAATGRLREALAWVDSSAGQGGGSSDVVRSALLLDAGRPREVLDLLRVRGIRSPRGDDLWARARHMQALVQLDSLAAARALLARFRAQPNRGAALARYVPLSIAANLALAAGRPDSALATLAALEQYQRLGEPELETRARALRALRRLPEAAATLEGELRRNGSRFIARYQLAQVYEAMGRTADAAREYGLFLGAWANADLGWPQVEDARRRLATLGVES